MLKIWRFLRKLVRQRQDSAAVKYQKRVNEEMAASHNRAWVRINEQRDEAYRVAGEAHKTEIIRIRSAAVKSLEEKNVMIQLLEEQAEHLRKDLEVSRREATRLREEEIPKLERQLAVEQETVQTQWAAMARDRKRVEAETASYAGRIGDAVIAEYETQKNKS